MLIERHLRIRRGRSVAWAIDRRLARRTARLVANSQGVKDFYVEKGFKGILLEGSGLGHISKFCFDAIKRATAKGVVVALASQCIWGRVNMNVYDTGRDLQSFGVVPLEDMFPETGLVKLMWVLGQTDDQKEAIKLLKTNIAGEYSPRTLPQEANLRYQGGQ